MQASALLLLWVSYCWARNLWVLIIIIIIIFSPSYVALCGSKALHRLSSESVSWCLEISLFLRLPSRDGALSLHDALPISTLRKEVGKNIKDKKRDKRERDGVPSREGSLKKREVSKHQETFSLPNLC